MVQSFYLHGIWKNARSWAELAKTSWVAGSGKHLSKLGDGCSNSVLTSGMQRDTVLLAFYRSSPNVLWRGWWPAILNCCDSSHEDTSISLSGKEFPSLAPALMKERLVISSPPWLCSTLSPSTTACYNLQTCPCNSLYLTIFSLYHLSIMVRNLITVHNCPKKPVLCWWIPCSTGSITSCVFMHCWIPSSQNIRLCKSQWSTKQKLFCISLTATDVFIGGSAERFSSAEWWA